MDIEKTREYYKHLNKKEVCNCAYCKNYRTMIETKYPKLRDYLISIGIDITKPFETNPWEVEKREIIYSPVQYILMGDKKGFKERTIEDVEVSLAETYPDTEINEAHFLIELSYIKLPWTSVK